MRSIAEYIHYFRTLGNFHPEVQSVVHGDSPRIINQQRSKLRYPCLWIETPDLETSREALIFRGGIVVLKNAKLDHEYQQDLAHEETLRIMQQILSRIRTDSDEGIFILTEPTRIDSISTLTHDNDYGWRAELEITREQWLCIDPCITDEIPAGMIAAFSWVNNSAVSGIQVSVNNNSIPAPATWTTFEWTYRFDDGAPTVHVGTTFPSLPPNSTADALYIELRGKIENPTLATYESVAKAVIRKTESCGISMPDDLILNIPPV